MISEKDLIPVFNFDRMGDNDDTGLEALKYSVAEISNKYGVSAAFREDKISRDLLSPDTTPCLVVFNLQHHRDYRYYCILRETQGSSCICRVYLCEPSGEAKKDALQQNAHSGSRRGFAARIARRRPGPTAKDIDASAADSAADKDVLTEEKDWYDLMAKIIRAALSRSTLSPLWSHPV